MSNVYAKHGSHASKYSAGGVSKLLWYIETKETVKLLQKYNADQVKNIIMSENLYSQKSEDRLKREFSEIKKRVENLPISLRDMIVSSDLTTSRLIVLIGAMTTDRMLFELIYEVYRRKLHMGDETLKQSDINVFFRNKQNQNEDVAMWSEKAVSKLKQTYQKYMLEAGIIESIEGNASEKKICRPYIDQDLREELLSNSMDKYLYSLTGEK